MEKIEIDLTEAEERVRGVHSLLDRLYYDPEFSTLFNRPILSMLMSACIYLADNLKALREKWLGSHSR